MKTLGKNVKQNHHLQDLPTFSHGFGVAEVREPASVRRSGKAGLDSNFLTFAQTRKTPQEKTPAAYTALCKSAGFYRAPEGRELLPGPNPKGARASTALVRARVN